MANANNFIIANLSSNSGKGAERWEKVKSALQRTGYAYECAETRSQQAGDAAVASAIAANASCIIAAGGDGTINAVLNALMDPATDQPRIDCALGAIGLGSSNDFQKPFTDGQDLGGCPARIAKDRVRSVDIGKAVYTDTQGMTHTRYFILNGSVGFVAEGNAFFNTADKVLNKLKRLHVEVAIIYTVLVNLIKFEPLRISLAIDNNEARTLKIASLSVLKKVHLAGGMAYDTPVTADDGYFDINIWGDMGRLEIVKTLVSLYGGKFIGLPKTEHLRAKRVEIQPEAPIHLELDGEVHAIRSVDISVLPKALKLCG